MITACIFRDFPFNVMLLKFIQVIMHTHSPFPLIFDIKMGLSANPDKK